MNFIHEYLSMKSNNAHYIEKYANFIKTRKNIGNHKHHILPKAKDMFPDFKCFKQNPWNMIKLTYREHFIAHKILAKIFPNSSQSRCFFYMLNKSNKSSKQYQMLLEQHRQYLKGNTHRLGKKDSDETRKRKSLAQKGRLLGKKIGLGNKSRTGQTQSYEEKQKRSAALKGNKNAKGSQSHKANLGRKFYHNPNTKQRKMFGNEPIPSGFVLGMGSF